MSKFTILALSVNQHHHYAPLHEDPQMNIIETDDLRPEVVQEIQPDLLMTLSCDYYKSYACIKAARKMRIPTLYVMDGIIEWRHQWENPRFGEGGEVPYNQPITADKAACLGWQSARTLESWDNVGKCEIVGAPRFDHYLTDPVEHVPSRGAKRLLIMTANTPGFTPEQHKKVARSLSDVRDYLAGQSAWEPIWRVRGGLDKQLHLKDQFEDLKHSSLREVFSVADAVLTTPSTVLLEAMLAELPTAILDYTNSPAYIPSAWMVTARDHIPTVLTDLREPSNRKLCYQDEILHNNLECYSPATPRMSRLIKEMVDIGRETRSAGHEVRFPARILPVELGGHLLPSTHYDLSELYPEHPVLNKKDAEQLRIELIHAQKELGILRAKIDHRKIGYWFGQLMSKLYGFYARWRRRKDLKV